MDVAVQFSVIRFGATQAKYQAAAEAVNFFARKDDYCTRSVCMHELQVLLQASLSNSDDTTTLALLSVLDATGRHYDYVGCVSSGLITTFLQYFPVSKAPIQSAIVHALTGMSTSSGQLYNMPSNWLSLFIDFFNTNPAQVAFALNVLRRSSIESLVQTYYHVRKRLLELVLAGRVFACQLLASFTPISVIDVRVCVTTFWKNFERHTWERQDTILEMLSYFIKSCPDNIGPIYSTLSVQRLLGIVQDERRARGANLIVGLLGELAGHLALARGEILKTDAVNLFMRFQLQQPHSVTLVPYALTRLAPIPKIMNMAEAPYFMPWLWTQATNGSLPCLVCLSLLTFDFDVVKEALCLAQFAPFVQLLRKTSITRPTLHNCMLVCWNVVDRCKSLDTRERTVPLSLIEACAFLLGRELEVYLTLDCTLAMLQWLPPIFYEAFLRENGVASLLKLFSCNIARRPVISRIFRLLAAAYPRVAATLVKDKNFAQMELV